MNDEQPDFEEVLLPLLDHNQPLALGKLKVLSDLDDEQQAIFQREWADVEPSHRRSLAQNMQEIGEESLDLDFRAAFMLMLDDDDAQVRIAAVRGLIEDTRRSTLRRLLTIVQTDPDDGVRANAAITLGGWGLRAAEGDVDQRISDELRETLLSIYNDQATSPLVRQRLLETLGYWGDDEVVIAAINQALRHADLLWQQAAICAMGHSGTDRWLTTIKHHLSHEFAAIRFEAARAAGEIGEDAQSLVNMVARLVTDDDIEVVTTALWALGQIGGSAARRLLEQFARDGEGAKREAAAEALNELQFYADPIKPLPFDDDDEDEDEYWYGEDGEQN